MSAVRGMRVENVEASPRRIDVLLRDCAEYRFEGDSMIGDCRRGRVGSSRYCWAGCNTKPRDRDQGAFENALIRRSLRTNLLRLLLKNWNPGTSSGKVARLVNLAVIRHGKTN
jgi:hypothetical protein